MKETTETLRIDGMTCSSCAARVQRALGEVDGVSTASVNLATKRATINFTPQLVSLEQLQDAVYEAGYDAEILGEENE